MSFQDFKQNTTRALVSKTVDGVLEYVNKDREAGLLKLTDISEKLMGDKFSKKVFDGARSLIQDSDAKYMQYVNRMLDAIGYKDHIVGKRILENSCGEGNILQAIVKRYIEDAKRTGLTQTEIKKGLECDIIAYEKDRRLVRRCRRNLNKVCREFQINDINWNIKKTDYLKNSKNEKKVDFVIGNPPYVTYHDISVEERKFLKEKYEVCRKGRFDYCYAFIEESICSLKENGKMVYLVPFSIFRNQYADSLRKYILDGIEEIIDLTGIKVFQGITCSVTYFIYKKGTTEDSIHYVKEKDGIDKLIQRDRLAEDGKKWIFHATKSDCQTFGDYLCIHNSIATLYNKAFLFTANQEKDGKLIGEQECIEKAICYPVISTKLKKTEIKEQKLAEKEKRAVQKNYIIFPYKRKNYAIEKYEEEEFRQTYPKAYVHLQKYRDALDKRKKDEHAKWFEYGRSQALKELWSEKLILPMVITQKAKVYRADAETIELLFEDSGVGVPEPEREKIFHAFYTTKEDDGIGLGLNIVKDIVSSYDGTIYVMDSKELGGAKFVVHFMKKETT